MFGYKSKAQKRRERALTVTGWSLVALFLIGLGDTVYKAITQNNENEGATDYNDWAGRG